MFKKMQCYCELGFRSTPVESLKQKYCDNDSKFIVIDGLEVHYKDQGEGPVLVLLHGVVSFLQTWDGWYEELKGRYRIIRLDLPGWGITGPWGKTGNVNYSGKRIARFLEKFLDMLGIERFYLAGNSLGAFYAWYYTTRHPERVQKLILLDPIAYNQSLPFEFALMKIPGVKFLVTHVVLPRFLIQNSINRLYGKRDRIEEKMYDLYWEMIMRAGNRNTLVLIFSMIAELSKSKNIFGDVKKIKKPVLMVWGKQDVWSRWKETLHEWQRDLPHAELIMYDNCGHMPMEEIPVETARDAHAFLMK
ncbi:MAG TPA: alpha/beta hydrolase [Smithella sp.]|nr:alpha/beta hydrolase [Smithella sp.]HNY49029.1 alpha/beta hydrolase [Smithella sp.]HOG90004.1 alpha/beta hydrolase [Smithella sp.]HQG66420.1 alpha/beta hydrolase [Smithella sp.]HQH17017.1 alpha/beta hydrolase [Smithella sp.]